MVELIAPGWRHYLIDTMTGQLEQEIDIPSFAWSHSVADSAFATTKQHTWGDDSIDNIELPWNQIRGRTANDRAKMLAPYKRGIVSFWRSGLEAEGSPGLPILGGALGVRTSTRRDVSMPYVSMLGLLESRYLVHADKFGKGPKHTSKSWYEFNNLSYRALACAVIQECMAGKPGGTLPIDLPYLGEHGTHRLPDLNEDEEMEQEESKARTEADKAAEKARHDAEVARQKKWDTDEKARETREKNQIKAIADKKRRQEEEKKRVAAQNQRKSEERARRDAEKRRHEAETKRIESAEKAREDAIKTSTRVRYFDYNVANHSCADILRSIAGQTDGPDMQFRPYLTEDGQHVRWRFLAGSDGDVHLHQDRQIGFASYQDVPGTIENLSVDRAAPVMRVYGVGAGSGTGAICHLAEDLRLTCTRDPWPLVERVMSDSALESYPTLQSSTIAMLQANSIPLMQIKGEIDAYQTVEGVPIHPLGSFWPGETCILHIRDFPDLPDGDYAARLMQMSGNQTGRVQLIFDVMADPIRD